MCYSSVPVSHGSLTVGHNTRTPESEAAESNSAIIHFIITPYLYYTLHAIYYTLHYRSI